MNRLTASVATAVVATGASFAPLAPAAVSAAAANVVQQVRAVDLGPQGPWVRVQDDPGTAGLPHGVQDVSPFTDPVRFNGSLHLSFAGGQQARAAHYFTDRIALSTVAAADLAYDSYLNGAGSTTTTTATTTATAGSLQLPMICRGSFTTLSFEPHLATDSQGRAGVVPDTWQHYVSSGSSLWRTSRALPAAPRLPAGSHSPMSDYVAACDAPGDGVIGVIASAGRPGDTTASLDTYVDNLTVNGTVYDFAVRGLATGSIRLNHSNTDRPCHHEVHLCPRSRGESVSGTIAFTAPADGPSYRAVGTRLVLSNGRALTPGDLTVTADGRPVTLTTGPGRTLTGVVSPSPGADLEPGGTHRTPVTITHRDGRDGAGTGGRGRLKVTAELLATGYEPLRRTRVVSSTSVRS